MRRIFRSSHTDFQMGCCGCCVAGESVASLSSGVSICLVPFHIHICCLGRLVRVLFSICICRRVFLSVFLSVVWRFGSLFAFRCFWFYAQ